MKKKQLRVFALVSIIILVISAVSAVCTYLALTRNFDHEIFHYGNTLAAMLARILPWCAAAIAAIFAIGIRGMFAFDDAVEPGAASPLKTFTSVLTSLLMIASAVFTFLGNRTAETRFEGIVWIAAVAAIFSGVYFAVSVLGKSSGALTALAFAPALWAASMLLREYFRAGEPINSPLRDMDLAAYSFILLFFTEKIRFRLKNHTPSIYFFCSLTALTFTVTSALPKLIVYFTDDSFTFNLIDLCLAVCIALFIAVDIVFAISSVVRARVPEHERSDT